MQIVRTVAIRANSRRHHLFFKQGLAVNGFSVRGERMLLQKCVLGHFILIFVANGAGFRDIEPVNRRLGIARAVNRMGIPVTVKTIRGRNTVLHGLAVVRGQINRSLHPVTGRAIHRLHLFGMRQFFYFSVAGSAEIAAMNGALKFIKVEIIMAGQAIFIGYFIRGLTGQRDEGHTKSAGCYQKPKRPAPHLQADSPVWHSVQDISFHASPTS
ncbi:MAG: hypothetical protein UV78_C0039G0017 [Parcubacteria group bacterium GW2011_GWA2_43_17]|nr:MAG: hypothetical protein UV78_C0039G0017 [Parcubacteria group bacterium GW2011_GWA2_43_17]